MPMIWSAEADAKLMATIIQMCAVKLTRAQMQEVAKLMGPECTAKAISHRMTHWRKQGSNGGDGGKSGTKDSKAGGRGKKPALARAHCPLEHDDGATTPATSRPKRAGAKRDYATLTAAGDSDADAEDSDGLNKKIKIEVGEDIGEGLRQATGPEDE